MSNINTLYPNYSDYFKKLICELQNMKRGSNITS